MELALRRQNDGFLSIMPIDKIDEELLEESRLTFAEYKKRGIILSGEYDDQVWFLTDEIEKSVPISFALNEVHNQLSTLSLTLGQAAVLLRVFTTLLFGFSLSTLRNYVNGVRAFLVTGAVPDDLGQLSALISFLNICPATEEADHIIQKLVVLREKSSPGSEKKRSLAFYMSYIRFNEVVSSFWATAKYEERLLYFPIWFWWSITSIIPLRPLETVLTPRDCIRVEDGKYYLTLRRTKLKGTTKAVSYKLKLDYELCKYQVPADLGEIILWYINASSQTYKSDIDILFDKTTQFRFSNVSISSDNHYTYENLRELLHRFSRDVVEKRFVICSDPVNLAENEINPVKLGDARHIAMISLIMQGGSPIICQELARHSSVNMSAHYYCNIENLVDILGEHGFFPHTLTDNAKEVNAAILDSHNLTPVENGVCVSQNYSKKSYEDCAKAVDENGRLGICGVCPFFVAKNGTQAMELTKKRMKKTWILLKETVNAARDGRGGDEDIGSLLDRLRTEMLLYGNMSATAKKLKEERGYY